MKKMWTMALVVLVVLAMVIIGCNKKKNIPLVPSDFGTATITSTVTMTFTNTPFLGTATSTPIVPTATFTETVSIPAWPSGFIDDCEDLFAPNANNFNGATPSLNLGGYWVTYDDNSNTNRGTSYAWPMSQTWATRKLIGDPLATPPYANPPFAMSAPGYPGSPYGTAFAVNVTGYVTTNLIIPPGETVGGFKYGFFGFGTQLTVTAGEPTCNEVDISAYTGVRFWCKGDAVANGWSVKIPFTTTTNSNCDGTVSTTASSLVQSDDYKHLFTAPATWTQISFPFSAFTQEGWGIAVSIADGRYWQGCSATHAGTTPGWLATCPMSTIQQHVKQIQFQTAGQTVVYPTVRSIWIDDIELY